MGVDAKVHINIKRNDFFLAFLLFSIEFNMPIHGFNKLQKMLLISNGLCQRQRVYYIVKRMSMNSNITITMKHYLLFLPPALHLLSGQVVKDGALPCQYGSFLLPEQYKLQTHRLQILLLLENDPKD